jgi:hypothetical protein
MSANNFHDFALRINAQYQQMSRGTLFITCADKGEVWNQYLKAFPEGTNPIYRTNTEHDCSCCRNFIKNIGRLVSIQNNRTVSVWDAPDLSYPYNVVASTMASFVKGHEIKSVFRTKEREFGDMTTYQQGESGLTNWNHLWGVINTEHRAMVPATLMSLANSTAAVLKRGLEEINNKSLETILDLIENNTIYRGAEFKNTVVGFFGLKTKYGVADNKHLFHWAHFKTPHARFRNTAIGTLAQDLSAGVDVEKAVHKYEAMVAPQNYKRPTALITQGMIDQATKTIQELGFEPALHRRLATIHDISVNNVLYVDNDVRGQMKDGIEGLLMKHAKIAAPVMSKAVQITGGDFLKNVLPRAHYIELFLENKHLNNFVNLTTSHFEECDANLLFKWSNNFAWSYDGDVTDSIKERVKRAGGSVEGDVCCRLSWDYTDDLDFHMQEPWHRGMHIYFRNVRKLSLNGGMLDLDANGCDGMKDEPCENIFYKDKHGMRPGKYELSVHNYIARHQGKKQGFEVEIELNGETHQFVYDMRIRGTETIQIASIEVTDSHELILHPILPVTGRSATKEKWGLKTQQLIPVEAITWSPNFWNDDRTGNLHWFFFLADCKNPNQARSLYNEFLNPALEKHRKVFEVLGAKLRCPVADDQLAGVGFSSTRKDKMTLVVTTEQTKRIYTVEF